MGFEMFWEGNGFYKEKQGTDFSWERRALRVSQFHLKRCKEAFEGNFMSAYLPWLNFEVTSLDRTLAGSLTMSPPWQSMENERMPRAGVTTPRAEGGINTAGEFPRNPATSTLGPGWDNSTPQKPSNEDKFWECHRASSDRHRRCGVERDTPMTARPTWKAASLIPQSSHCSWGTPAAPRSLPAAAAYQVHFPETLAGPPHPECWPLARPHSSPHLRKAVIFAICCSLCMSSFPHFLRLPHNLNSLFLFIAVASSSFDSAIIKARVMLSDICLEILCMWLRKQGNMSTQVSSLWDDVLYFPRVMFSRYLLIKTVSTYIHACMCKYMYIFMCIYKFWLTLT